MASKFFERPCPHQPRTEVSATAEPKADVSAHRRDISNLPKVSLVPDQERTKKSRIIPTVPTGPGSIEEKWQVIDMIGYDLLSHEALMQRTSSTDLASIKQKLRFTSFPRNDDGFVHFGEFMVDLMSCNPSKSWDDEEVISICRSFAIATTLCTDGIT